MLLMVERRIRGRICHSTYRYTKANNAKAKLTKIILKIKNRFIFNTEM